MKEDVKEKSLTFEEAYRKLETVVDSLDAGKVGLEEALDSYETGINLLKICREKLNGATRKIERLKGVDEQGCPVLSSLSESELKSLTNVVGRQASEMASSLTLENEKVGEKRDVLVSRKTSVTRRVVRHSEDADNGLLFNECNSLLDLDSDECGCEKDTLGMRLSKNKESLESDVLIDSEKPPF